jgi:hypothetical protein
MEIMDKLRALQRLLAVKMEIAHSILYMGSTDKLLTLHRLIMLAGATHTIMGGRVMHAS